MRAWPGRCCRQSSALPPSSSRVTRPQKAWPSAPAACGVPARSHSLRASGPAPGRRTSCRSRILASSSATAFSCILKGVHLDWRSSAPTRACAGARYHRRAQKPLASSILMTPMCATLWLRHRPGRCRCGRGAEEEEAGCVPASGRAGVVLPHPARTGWRQHGHAGNAGQRVEKAVKRMPGGPAEQRGANYSGGVAPHRGWRCLLLKCSCC